MQRLALAFILLLAARGSIALQVTFDVASIRPAEPKGEAIEVVPGSVTMRSFRMVSVIRWAYGIQEYQVSGPGWLTEARFDIVAKAGSPAPESDLRLMLRALLAERFKLAVHRESRELPSLIVTVGKNGHKLKPNDVEGSPSFKTGKMTLTGEGATVSQLTDFLSREMRQPVVNQTGLTGRFNYFLDVNAYITDEARRSGGPGGGPPPEAASLIAQAIQAQLGLKIDGRKAPVEMLIVERIEKTPTEN
jgi:uncharacterized protein (TIGR03435 family)